MEILKQHTKNFSAIVYGQRLGTPNIYEDLLQLDIIIIDEKTKLLSKRKQRLPELALELKKTPPLACTGVQFCLDIIIVDAKTNLLAKRKQRLSELALELKHSTPALYWRAILSQRSYENNKQSIALS